MSIPRPAKGVRWLFSQAPTYGILVAVFASVVAFISAWNFVNQKQYLLAAGVAVAACGVLVCTAVQHVIGLRAARQKESVHELEGCLHTLLAILNPPDGCRVRLAIHVPVGETLEQITEYIGDTPKPGRIGRQFPANAGIIGKAFRERTVFTAQRVNDDYEAYVRELVTEWNYTEERARRLSPGSMAWMAVPFSDRDQPIYAVLFVDASRRDFFTDLRQELILGAVSGMAVFIGRRYAG
jgi:hypothetical protein